LSKNKCEFPPSEHVFSERHAQYNFVRAVDPMSNLDLFRHAAAKAEFSDSTARAKRDCRKFRRGLLRREVLLPHYLLEHIDFVMRERPDLQRLSTADTPDGKIIIDFPSPAEIQDTTFSGAALARDVRDNGVAHAELVLTD
jgi:hypothetical protein